VSVGQPPEAAKREFPLPSKGVFAPAVSALSWAIERRVFSCVSVEIVLLLTFKLVLGSCPLGSPGVTRAAELGVVIVQHVNWWPCYPQ
jgi:hypothetical protein